MKLLSGFEQPDAYRRGIISIGNFDGVHRGHQSMVTALIRQARGANVPAVVFTFDPHPTTILRPGSTPPPLSTVPRKAQLLETCGVDCMIVYPTDAALLDLDPREFFDRVVLGELQASGLVEGPNFRFGRDRAGDIGTLRGFCEEATMSLEIVPPVSVAGRMVSSTAIRGLIATGNVTKAAELLGHRYRVRGHVARGIGRGSTIGFPTANLEDVATVLPQDGVYAGLAVREGELIPAAINLGANPTFGESHRKLEVHLIDFAADLYGQILEVEFVERLRDTIPFESADHLKSQLQKDIRHARKLTRSAK